MAHLLTWHWLITIMAALVLAGLAATGYALAYSDTLGSQPGQAGPPAQENSPAQPATVALGSGMEHLSPKLWALLYKQATNETVPERGAPADTAQRGYGHAKPYGLHHGSRRNLRG